MLFTSISFLYYFLPTIIILYFITPKKYRNYILLIFSIIFYMYGEPKYVILMLVEILVAYFGALLIDKYKSKEIFLITIIIHIGLLCVFKYTDLFIGTINSIFKTNISFLNIALPIGISFYTFQILSYVIDVYRGKVKVQKNILKLATYVSLFPQLIAGPIVRYETICDELDNRDETIEKFSLGVRRFIIGLAKKVLIANMLGELCTKFSLVDERSVLFYWIFAISYMLQVYFDFSAYSDMAIGLGKMFGFTFLENFNYPFISKSITEFWRRWHISLSSWFKDYVYIPLGGSRKGTLKLVRNILIVWFLTGIWHGAAYNFIIWGLFIGVFLVIEKLWLSKYISKLPKFLRNIYVLFIIMISFIMFNAGSINEAFFNIKGLFGLNKEVFINNYTIYYLKSYLIVLIIAIFGATPLFKNIIEKLYGNTLKTSVSRLEKYAQCPFSYYLQYGLRLKEKEELKVQNFDTGSFMHETIDEFFKKVQEEKIELPELLAEISKIEVLVDKVIEEKIDNGRKYTFVATAKYKVLIRRLKRIVSKALKYIIEGLVYSDFNIEGTEIEFGKNGKYKPIQLQILESGKRVEITGKIDRIDTATSDDGKYLRIIDYKSSAKNIDLNEVYAGLQLQLLTYMDAVCKEEDLMPAGVLYFSLLEQIASADKKITEEEIEEKIRKNFKMKGLILADVKIIRMHDNTLKSGSSKLIPAAITTQDSVNENWTSGVNKEEFKVLQDYIYKTIKQISKEILNGKIDLKPYNKSGKTPCDYCSYKAICGFDTRICGNNYNYIDKKTKDDIITMMKK